MSFHELKKFNEWVTKLERAIDTNYYRLRYCCERLIHWANKIKEINYEYYNDNIKKIEYSLLLKALPLIYENYNQYLIDSEKHSEYTKIKQEKIMRFIYHFTKYLIPIADRIMADDFLKNKIDYFMMKYSSSVLFDLSNLDEYEINSLLKFIIKSENLGLSNIYRIRQLIEKDIIKRNLEEEAAKDLEGESAQVEFKGKLPSLNQLAKVIASFASTNGGRIYLGVKDDGEILGFNENTIISFDKFQQDLANITTNTIKPSINIDVSEYYVGDKKIIQIKVPKGTDPLYYVKNTPYVRVLTTSRPATPVEIKYHHLRYFIDYLQTSIR